MDTDGFFRNLEEKQVNTLVCLDQYFETAVSNKNQKQKDAALYALTEIADVMSGQMAVADKPKWLSELVNIGDYRRKNPNIDGSWQECFRKVRLLESQIRQHKWIQRRGDVDPIVDIDGLIEKYRNKEEVQRLFDELIKALEGLVACGELDSRRVVEDIEKLLATLRKSRTGSFQFQILSKNVAKRYVRNLGVSWLEDTKVAKLLIKAANKTADELDITIDEAKHKIQEEVSGIEVRMFERLSQSAPPKLDYKPLEPNVQKKPDGDWLDATFEKIESANTAQRLTHKKDTDEA